MRRLIGVALTVLLLAGCGRGPLSDRTEPTAAPPTSTTTTTTTTSDSTTTSTTVTTTPVEVPEVDTSELDQLVSEIEGLVSGIELDDREGDLP